jgi:hypothetical protein
MDVSSSTIPAFRRHVTVPLPLSRKEKLYLLSMDLLKKTEISHAKEKELKCDSIKDD